MSGHSKWSTIKRKKGLVDAKRGKIFTKLGREIMVAARNGDDPTMNFALRLAVDRAKAMNMPKDNIDRAITRGAGTGDGALLLENMYEAVGPQGVGFIIDVLTDSKNRTSAELKHALSKHGASLSAPNSILWMFDRKGVLVIPHSTVTDDIELMLIDAGAEDIVQDDEDAIITTEPEHLQILKTRLEDKNIQAQNVSLEWIPKESSVPDEKTQNKIHSILDALEDLDDVQNVATTAELSDHENT
jgi:YebC/PmpR family DNA-binding regulatory protein